MESFFHGSSSGTDPLIWYLETALVIQKEKGIRRVDLDLKQLDPAYQFFVVNTGIARKTEPWVQYFIEKAQEPVFKNQMEQELIPASNQAIESLLDYRSEDLFDQMVRISQFHLEYLSTMIRDDFHDLWAKGLEGDADFRLKLCGAGGGGYILGLSRNPAQLTEIEKSYQIERI